VTLDDEAANKKIIELLEKTDLPVVSEESTNLHLKATEYWLVDPLDGTKDFIDKNDEFTVNVALIKNGYPILGVVNAPALHKTYVGVPTTGAWLIKNNQWTPLTEQKTSKEVRLATSRFHGHSNIDLFSAALGITQKIPVGSALKYCLHASAEVDVFPRLAGCSEWDTGAGQSVLESVGGSVLDWATGNRLSYGKLGRRNPPLLSFRAPYAVEDFKNDVVEGFL